MGPIMSISMEMFPYSVARIAAWMETFMGLGLMLGIMALPMTTSALSTCNSGPVVGSGLFAAGGFGLPFFVMGALQIWTALVVATLMPGERRAFAASPEAVAKARQTKDEEAWHGAKEPLSIGAVIKVAF